MRKQGLNIAMILVFFALSAIGASAAELSGTVYTQDLAVAKYSLLLVGSTPPQRIILDTGEYNITLAPGSYKIEAYYSTGGQTYEDRTTLNISGEGAYTYDFILFPTEGNTTELLPDIEELAQIEAKTVERKSADQSNTIVGTVVATFLAIAALLYVWTRKTRPAPQEWKKRPVKRTSPATKKRGASQTMVESEPTKSPATPVETTLPADLQSIITALKEEDGRTTQKELRKRIPCSEAKMSMMLTELEHKGRIERIKKGRGNLIVLKR